MNIAPFLIARLNDWQLPSDPVVDRGLAAIETNARLFEFPLRALGLTEVVDLLDEPLRERLPVGLYSMRLARWDSALARTTEARGPERFKFELAKLPLRFVRGIVLESLEKVLLFPDDGRPEPRFSLFAPALNGRHDLVLHTITTIVGGNDGQPTWRVATDDNGCSLSVSGEFPNRHFLCSRTGCAHKCRHGRRIEGNSVKTIFCEC